VSWSVGEILGPGGVLARALPAYEPRPSQVDMAELVADALATRRPLLVEAGTGTGKTLAYLVPAILSGLKVVVSTGTKNLQEQIYRKDLPLLAAELPRAFKAAYMKGISNYLCLRRFVEHDTHAAVRGATSPELDAIRAWARVTETGDRAELPELADDAPLWRDVSPTQETRLGARCPYYERCFVTRARWRAQAADLLIVNHHLFFADLALRAAWPDARLLPAYEAVIFDEAHQLEDIASDYFGVAVSSLRLNALTRDAVRAVASERAPDRIADVAAHVERRARAMWDALGPRLRARPAAGELIAAGGEARVAMHAGTWENEPEREAHALDTALEELAAALDALDGSALDDGGDEAAALAARAQAIRSDLALLVDGAARHDRKHVFWAELRGRGVYLHASPIDVAGIVRERVLGAVDAAVFTSATLTAGGSFEFVRARLGLESAMEARLPSPFDYAQQALLYLPHDLPEPSDDAFVAAAAARMRELCDITDGRAFLLFTSWRKLERVLAILRRELRQPILVQGEKPKHLLVEDFKANVGSVLLATSSFWEGVDVVGEALSLVVMDKLPFAPPDDPLTAARAARLEDEGLDPFHAYHLPRAALALAQGFGRLIRHRDDRGVVALLDKRASTRGYGRRVLAALPRECPRTAVLDDVRKFWAH
jgi:ATP-dependent DNA helicase DinG